MNLVNHGIAGTIVENTFMGYDYMYMWVCAFYFVIIFFASFWAVSIYYFATNVHVPVHVIHDWWM